jgi:hypothetical protein
VAAAGDPGVTAAAEEGADPIQRGGGPLDEVPVAEDQHLVAGEGVEQMLQLFAVPAEPDMVPEVRPPVGDPPLLGLARAHQVADRLQPGRPQMRPVGMGPLDRVAQRHDEPDAGAASEVALFSYQK